MGKNMNIPKIYAQNIKKQKIDLSLSENPLGCSPLVALTLKKLTIKDVSNYPSTDNLIAKISQKFKINSKNIIIGNGSEQLIKIICQAFVNKGTPVLVQRGSFGLFTRECLLVGGKVKFFTPEDLLKTTQTAKVIFLCNPNNPTGEVIANDLINKIIQTNPDTIVVIDEANGEFIKNSLLQQAVEKPNCIVIKTFSKVFGLAGVRIGFAVGGENLIKTISAFQQLFPVSAIANCLALTSLEDEEFVTKTIKFMNVERRFLTQELENRNLTVSKSVTNNLFIEISQTDKLVKKLNLLGVSVINGSFFPGMKKSGFRISIKKREINKQFLKRLDLALSLLNKQKLLTSKNI